MTNTNRQALTWPARAPAVACQVRTVALLLVLWATIGCGPDGSETETWDGLEVASADISAMSWLQGYWSRIEGSASSEEIWMPSRAGVMYGLHVDVFSSGRSFFEFLRIESRGDTLAYLASPRGRPPTTFLATVVGDGVVVFSNPGHDYPQNIGYTLVGTDSVRSEIWGSASGEERRSSTTWGRSTFPASADGF